MSRRAWVHRGKHSPRHDRAQLTRLAMGLLVVLLSMAALTSAPLRLSPQRPAHEYAHPKWIDLPIDHITDLASASLDEWHQRLNSSLIRKQRGRDKARGSTGCIDGRLSPRASITQKWHVLLLVIKKLVSDKMAGGLVRAKEAQFAVGSKRRANAFMMTPIHADHSAPIFPQPPVFVFMMPSSSAPSIAVTGEQQLPRLPQPPPPQPQRPQQQAQAPSPPRWVHQPQQILAPLMSNMRLGQQFYLSEVAKDQQEQAAQDAMVESIQPIDDDHPPSSTPPSGRSAPKPSTRLALTSIAATPPSSQVSPPSRGQRPPPPAAPRPTVSQAQPIAGVHSRAPDSPFPPHPPSELLLSMQSARTAPGSRRVQAQGPTVPQRIQELESTVLAALDKGIAANPEYWQVLQANHQYLDPAFPTDPAGEIQPEQYIPPHRLTFPRQYQPEDCNVFLRRPLLSDYADTNDPNAFFAAERKYDRIQRGWANASSMIHNRQMSRMTQLKRLNARGELSQQILDLEHAYRNAEQAILVSLVKESIERNNQEERRATTRRAQLTKRINKWQEAFMCGMQVTLESQHQNMQLSAEETERLRRLLVHAQQEVREMATERINDRARLHVQQQAIEGLQHQLQQPVGQAQQPTWNTPNSDPNVETLRAEIAKLKQLRDADQAAMRRREAERHAHLVDAMSNVKTESDQFQANIKHWVQTALNELQQHDQLDSEDVDVTDSVTRRDEDAEEMTGSEDASMPATDAEDRTGASIAQWRAAFKGLVRHVQGPVHFVVQQLLHDLVHVSSEMRVCQRDATIEALLADQSDKSSVLNMQQLRFQAQEDTKARLEQSLEQLARQQSYLTPPSLAPSSKTGVGVGRGLMSGLAASAGTHASASSARRPPIASPVPSALTPSAPTSTLAGPSTPTMTELSSPGTRRARQTPHPAAAAAAATLHSAATAMPTDPTDPTPSPHPSAQPPRPPWSPWTPESQRMYNEQKQWSLLSHAVAIASDLTMRRPPELKCDCRPIKGILCAGRCKCGKTEFGCGPKCHPHAKGKGGTCALNSSTLPERMLSKLELASPQLSSAAATALPPGAAMSMPPYMSPQWFFPGSSPLVTPMPGPVSMQQHLDAVAEEEDTADEAMNSPPAAADDDNSLMHTVTTEESDEKAIPVEEPQEDEEEAMSD